jgi:hypothetical protein
VRIELVLRGIFMQLSGFNVEIDSDFPNYTFSAEVKNKCISPKISINVRRNDI